MTDITHTSLATLTEHAAAVQVWADEQNRRWPGSKAAAEARGEAIGWRHALILMGGTMPDLGGET